MKTYMLAGPLSLTTACALCLPLCDGPDVDIPPRQMSVEALNGTLNLQATYRFHLRYM